MTETVEVVPGVGRQVRRLRPVVIFLVLATGLAWLVALPLWMGVDPAGPALIVVALIMMTTPAIAALVVVRGVERPARALDALGLWPVGPVRRFLRFLVLAFAVPLALIVSALPVGAALGVYTADLENFSGLARMLSEIGAADVPMPLEALVALQVVGIVPAAVLNTLPALGEEIGWRGWLFPRLLPLGSVAAVVVSGIAWGLWHAPLVLLGYNYPSAPGWLGVLLMIGMCTLVGAVFGWLRLRSGSVWPAAFAHGTLNAAAGLGVLFSSAVEPVNTVHATILGWSGWIVPLAVVVWLLATGRLSAVTIPKRSE